MSLGTQACALSEVHCPSMPCAHSRPEQYAMVPHTLSPLRVSLGGPRADGLACPGGDQRAPRLTAGLVGKEDQPLTTRGSTPNVRPFVTEPGVPTRFVAMVRPKARLVQRKSQMVPQRADRLALVVVWQVCCERDTRVLAWYRVFVGILQRFGDLSHQDKACVDIQRLTSITQEPVEALGLGVVLKNQRRTALVLVQIEGFENARVVDALQQPKLPLCRLPSHTAAEFCRLQRLRIDPHTARDPGEPDVGCLPILICRRFPKQPL